jgi:energy-coupling factor transporter ATP-binding protein EcfA2
MEGKTVVAIAHRLSTIAAMDRLVVMDRGRIVGDRARSRAAWLAGGIYARLWAHQSRRLHRRGSRVAGPRLHRRPRPGGGQHPASARLAPRRDNTGVSTVVDKPAQGARALTGYRPFWAKRFGTAPFLPMSARRDGRSSAGTRAT